MSARSTIYQGLGALLLCSLISACSDDPAAGGDTGSFQDTGSEPDITIAVPGCEEDIGSVDLGPVTLVGGVAEIRFTVPSCAQGFILQFGGPDLTFMTTTLINPDGEVLVSDELPDDVPFFVGNLLGPFVAGTYSPNPVTQGQQLAMAFVPNGPLVNAPPGEYTATIWGGSLAQGAGNTIELVGYDGDIDAEVVWKTQDTMADGARLDLTIYLTGAGDLNAGNADESQLLQGALGGLETIYAQAGIDIGAVRYYDLPSSYRTVMSMDGAGSHLDQLFAESFAARQGLNFFLVDRFEGGMGGGIAGISGGIPGPALRPGTSRSGVAIALSLTTDSSTLAHVMAHEGGHWLGLFHTSEFTGGADPLPDTPEGRDSAINIMYPTVGGDTGLTQQQARVLNNHPEVSP